MLDRPMGSWREWPGWICLPAFPHPAHAGRGKEQLPSSPHLCNNNQGSAHLWPSISVWRNSSGASCPTFRAILWLESPGIWLSEHGLRCSPKGQARTLVAIGSMKDNPPSESALSSSSTTRNVSLAALAVAVLSEPKYFHCIFWEELERSTLSSKI